MAIVLTSVKSYVRPHECVEYVQEIKHSREISKEVDNACMHYSISLY